MCHIVLAVKACARREAGVLVSALRAAMTAALRCDVDLRQAIPPAEKEIPMRHSIRSACSLNLRSRVISLAHSAPSFTAGFVADNGGATVQVSDDEIIETALRILASRVSSHTPLDDPKATRQYVALRFAGLEHEILSCLYLDNHCRVIACEDIFRGTIDGCSVHPREVVKQALVHNAAAIILAHNHPSGIAEPSQADGSISVNLKAALALVNIRLLDHLIVGGGSTTSMAERGLL